MCFKWLIGTKERPSPQDWVDRGDIDTSWVESAFNNQVKVWIPSIPDTNSMDGIFDAGNNNILIAGKTVLYHRLLVDRLEVGDIAVYRIEEKNLFIIHRIVKIGEDKEGKYFTFKGDNNASKDSSKVRPHHIKWISIGVIY